MPEGIRNRHPLRRLASPLGRGTGVPADARLKPSGRCSCTRMADKALPSLNHHVLIVLKRDEFPIYDLFKFIGRRDSSQILQLWYGSVTAVNRVGFVVDGDGDVGASLWVLRM